MFDVAWNHVVVDVTDVIRHFERTSRVTGIQRVVTRLASSLFEAGAGASAFDEKLERWRAVDAGALIRLFEASRSAAPGDPGWQDAVARVHGGADAATPFPPGTLLLSLGAHWDADRAFMAVRQLQATAGLVYAVVVHDTVPLKLPEVTTPSVVRVYKRWFAAAVENADVLIAISDAVERELRLACDRSGLTPRAVVRCALAGSLDEGASPRPCTVRSDVAEVLDRTFVLFVGTVEPRKDHLFVLSCWRSLIAELGADEAPLLVIVGSLGWRFEPVLMALEDPALGDSVRLFTDLHDEDLIRLYDRCLFTVYNSLHEGWGLPVTESVARGRVPLIPRHSGLLDSGAEVAVYYSPGSAADFIAKATRLIVDPAFRGGCEERLLARRRIRPWADIAADLCADVAAAARKPRRPLGVGTVYAFSSEPEGQDLGRYAGAEALRFSGFHHLEPWGVWTSALEFRLAGRVAPGTSARNDPRDAPDALVAYLAVKVIIASTRLTFFVNLRRCRAEIELEPGRFCLKVPVVLRAPTDDFTLGVRQTRLNDVSSLGDGRDIGLGLEAFMLCHPSDALARLDFLEHFSGCRVIAL